MRVKNVLQYLENTAAHLGGKVAFSAGTGEETLTFAETQAQARRVGSALLVRGMRGARVALLMDRRPATIAAMFGVWYAGACSVVLDVSMPKARLRELLASAQVTLVVAEDRLVDDARALDMCPVVEYGRLATAAEDAQLLTAQRIRQIDTDPIYTVFTSGSTGRPKGVIACHRSVIDYAEALTKALDVSEQDVFGCQAPLSFDAPLKEILSAIVCGATTYLIPRRCFLFPPLLLTYLREQRINAVCWVPSAFLQISALGALESDPPLTLRRVVFGGETFPREHYDRWRAALPDATFYQLYGPTEATGMSCVWRAGRVLEAGERIPIGAPLDNTDLLLINENGERIEPCGTCESEEGEVYLRGSCLALGYLNAHDETAAAFVQNPLHNDYPETVYRTGDLARYNAHGELVFLGRRDAMIKRMGYRIEPGEIEACALHLPRVQDAVCIFSEASQELTLLYTGEAAEADVMAWLRAQLPRYMLPGAAVRTDEIPYTQNGKKDRRAALRAYGQSN